MKKKIRCVIVGLGNIGLKYDLKNKNIHTHAKSISFLERFILIGGIDKKKDNLRIFEKKYKSSIYKNFKLGLKSSKPDLIVISSPTKLRFNHISKVLRYSNPKIIIIEKPIADNLNNAKKIVNICNKKKVKVFINLYRYSQQSTYELKRKIFQANKKKEIIKCIINYNKGYFHNFSHFFNLCIILFGEFEYLKKLYFKKKISDNDYLIKAKLKFKKCLVDIVPNNIIKSCNLKIKTKDLYIKYLNDGNNISLIKKVNDKNKQTKIVKLKNRLEKYQLNVYKELEKFLDNKKFKLCDINQAYKDLEIMNSIIGK